MTLAAARPTTRSRTTLSAAAQVKAQRRGYAQAVVRALAKAYRGQPAPVVTRALKGALGPLKIRLSPTALQQLAAAITAGTAAELP